MSFPAVQHQYRTVAGPAVTVAGWSDIQSGVSSNQHVSGAPHKHPLTVNIFAVRVNLWCERVSTRILLGAHPGIDMAKKHASFAANSSGSLAFDYANALVAQRLSSGRVQATQSKPQRSTTTDARYEQTAIAKKKAATR